MLVDQLSTDSLRPVVKVCFGSAWEDVQELLLAMPLDWRPHLIGGFLRDLIIQECFPGRLLPPNDIDIIVGGPVGVQAFADFVTTFRPERRNRFGGYQLKLYQSKQRLDIWRMVDDAAFKGQEQGRSIRKVLRQCILEVDAVAWDLRGDTFLEGGISQALKTKRLDVRDRPHITAISLPECAHLLMTAEKLKGVMSLSSAAYCFISQVCHFFSRRTLLVEVKRTAEIKHRADYLFYVTQAEKLINLSVR